MELTPSEAAAEQLRFENFFKKVLREAAIDYDRQIYYRSKNQNLFSELPEHIIDNIYTTDVYFVSEHIFNVLDENIFVENDQLAEALRNLPQKERDIILLKYYLEMSDSAIGKKLKMMRQTVQYTRVTTIEELKKKMGEKENEKNKKDT